MAAKSLSKSSQNEYNPQNDFLGYSETKRPKFKAEKKNEMVF